MAASSTLDDTNAAAVNHPGQSMRLAAIPIDHVTAEITAFPLASEAAFELGLTSISTDGHGQGTAFWRRTEQELVRTAPGVSLDEIVCLRDLIWFGSRGGKDQTQPLHSYLRRIARDNLAVRGAQAAPVVGDGATTAREDGGAERRARQRWRWLSFALPPDLLLAGLAGRLNGPDEVDLQVPQVRQRLTDEGFAETHLHIGAASDFPLLWVATLRRLADTDLKREAFRSPGAAFEEGKRLGDWLLRAALARYVLASFLRWRGPGGGGLAEYLRVVARVRLIGPLSISGLTVLDRALRELARGRLLEPASAFADLKALYANLTRVSAVPIAVPRSRVRYLDPIAGLFRPGLQSEATPEGLFAAEGLHYLEGGGAQDVEFACLFWQCLRVRALYFRHLVQRPMTPGLPWFIRSYGRLKPGRAPLTMGAQLESAAVLCGLGHGLRSLEVRTSPNTAWSDLLVMLNDTFHALRAINSPGGGRPTPFGAAPDAGAKLSEFGFVLHLARSRGNDFNDGKPKSHWQSSHADPAAKANVKGYRYGGFFAQKERETMSFARLLLSFPESLWWVRGIDACTDEIGVPHWVMAPFFRYLTDVGQRVSAYLNQEHGWPVPPLRRTVHAGEDFVHLLGGLRSLSNSLERLRLQPGDRLGHGVALGIDASAWARGAGRLPMCREHRLFDLTWEWTRYARYGVRFDNDRLALIQDEVARLSGEIFGEELRARPRDVAQLLEDLYDEDLLRWTGFPTGNPPRTGSQTDPRYRRLLAYLTSPGVFQRGHQIEWVVVQEPERAALEHLQAHVRAQVNAQGLTVEINPSSNLLIANLGDLRSHPLWRLRPPVEKGGGPPLRVCIGSDDPITFNTTLPGEYMLLHDVLVLGGLSCEDADRWLDRARQTGLDARFTLPLPDLVPCQPRWLIAPGLETGVAPILFGGSSAQRGRP